jgi:glycosyltransferase involved in cell wall biosynthesis
MDNFRLSAVIITFNEETNIERCVRSLEPVTDDIIILDAFSSDKTLSLASSHPKVRAFQKKWDGFSNAKNHANQLATGNYILSVDADEELSPELQQSILKLKNSAGRNDVFEVNRLTNYCGRWIRHSGWYPEYKTRIFPKGVASWQGTLHEELVFSKTVTKKKLEGHLLHYSYPTIDSHLAKIIAYAHLAVEKDLSMNKRYTFINHALFKPFFVFCKKYLFQAGFLDGFYGFVIAVNSAYERFLRYAKFRDLK